MDELKTIKLTLSEYELLLYALDSAIEYCAEYAFRKDELDIIRLRAAIKSC